MSPKNIQIEDYNYNLSEERIAKFPVTPRDSSKLLVYNNGVISQNQFSHVADYLPENSLMVFNNTKVIQARLIFQKETGAQIEIFCLEPKFPSDYALVFQTRAHCSWLCLIGNLKRWKNGKLIKKVSGARRTVHEGELSEEFELYAEKIESYGESHLVKFSWNNPEVSFAEILDICGELPIPPYLNRKTENADKETYQTVYSKIKGSVAAPTAGLHFTPAVFELLKKKNVVCEELTLHVGAGTFKPVKTETIENHEMHTELTSTNKETIEKLLKYQERIYAVGTTSVRTLESLYYVGVLLGQNPELPADQITISQWMPYEKANNQITTTRALDNILQYMNKNRMTQLVVPTRIMIAPGYEFKIVNGIITNFHQPKSTLLLLVSAFVKGRWKEIYDYALENEFRFLSYGDSSLLRMKN